MQKCKMHPHKQNKHFCSAPPTPPPPMCLYNTCKLPNVSNLQETQIKLRETSESSQNVDYFYQSILCWSWAHNQINPVQSWILFLIKKNRKRVGAELGQPLISSDEASASVGYSVTGGKIVEQRLHEVRWTSAPFSPRVVSCFEKTKVYESNPWAS